MRIAQVAPLHESVPPPRYGGIERIVSYLTEEHVRMGHDVTLYASGDSATPARLRPGCAWALRPDPLCEDTLPHHLAMLHQVLLDADQFDVIHFHTGYLHLPFTGFWGVPTVTTAHDRMDRPDARRLYRIFRTAPHVSLSYAQRKPMPWLDWVATIPHGLPPDLYSFTERPEEYLAFLGRLSPAKGIEAAVEIAVRAGVPLRVAAKVGREDRDYYERVLRRLFEHPLVEYLGEIDDREKQEFLGNAAAVLFPIDWPEPFGLVMIEAMACGTPIVAFAHGAVPEVLDDGVTGFVVNGIGDAVAAVLSIPRLSRRLCRQRFEDRFTARRMADRYIEIYGRLTEGSPHRRHVPGYRARGRYRPGAPRSTLRGHRSPPAR